MKKMIKMSAIMLTLFAAVMMVSCGPKASGEAGQFVELIDQASSAIKKGDVAEIQKINYEMMKFQNSTYVLTDNDKEALGKAIFDMTAQLADKAGVGKNMPSWGDVKSRFMKLLSNVDTLGDFFSEMERGRFN